jgi:dephospho-CoA kinase
MLTIGWTGGVCAGKTTALRCLGEIAALEVLDADALGHRLLRQAGIRGRLVELLGAEVLGADGELDRGAVGRRVFADRALLERFNAVVHPPLVERIGRAVAAARQRQPKGREAFVVDAALIYEWGIQDLFDVVVAVRAVSGLALRRLRERGLDEDGARRRMAAQLPAESKARRADFVVVNDDDLTALRRRVRFLWEHQLYELRRERGTVEDDG